MFRLFVRQTQKFQFRFSTLQQQKLEKENQLKYKLQSQLNASDVQVKDIGSGCGAMYDIIVESPLFVGKSRVQQHQMVQQVIKEEMLQIHGINLKTHVPQKDE